jgi:hypothetical protein
LFPAGSIEFDSAWLMRDIEHEWHAAGTLCCGEAATAPFSYRERAEVRVGR